jgi:hypothetical protein
MRVAILSESPADESALRIIADALLGVKTITVAKALRSRGWPSVRNILPAVINHLNYQTDADGLIVVADSNHTSLSAENPKSRMRDLRELAQQCRQQLKTTGGRVPLKIAVGIAAPAIEGWWLCKSRQHINEATWEKGLNEKRDPYSKLELKKWLYESDYASLELMTRKMTEAAHEVARDLSHLETAFPMGFGLLAKEVRDWKRVG